MSEPPPATVRMKPEDGQLEIEVGGVEIRCGDRFLATASSALVARRIGVALTVMDGLKVIRPRRGLIFELISLSDALAAAAFDALNAESQSVGRGLLHRNRLAGAAQAYVEQRGALDVSPPTWRRRSRRVD